MARVLKARYFPNSSFLEATKGGNPSYISSSLLESQDVIRRSVRWRVGDGSSIRIRNDKWLSNHNNARVESIPFPYLENAKISSIIDN